MAPPTGTVPPELPPSVEAAYRKKCIQLKTRLNEVEEANDASRQRLARLNRSIQKLRLERAFLLEQLAKRTSTNVEDSEGSPSPPPTPKEKPLRTKRGHRKPDFLTSDMPEGRPGIEIIHQGPVTLSPSSDAFSHTHADPQTHQFRNSTPQSGPYGPPPNKRPLPTNGTPSHSHAGPSSTTRRPKNAFDLYCEDQRPILVSRHQNEPGEGSYDPDAALAHGWSTLDQDKKDSYSQKFRQWKAEKDSGAASNSGIGLLKGVFDSTRPAPEDADEDVEMADDAGTPSVPEVSGFTAVNRS